MECVVVALTPGEGRAWREALEDQGERWRCTVTADAREARGLIYGGRAEVVVPGESAEGRALEAWLRSHPPLPAPFVMSGGFDGALTRGEAHRMAALAESGRLPCLALAGLERTTCMARGLLRALGMEGKLRAEAYLPDMAALAAAYPALTADLRGRLYALVARRHGTTAGAVERSLRTAVERAWRCSELAGLERFFGSGVDPERGKPTNREFLVGLQERLWLAARRMNPEDAATMNSL